MRTNLDMLLMRTNLDMLIHRKLREKFEMKRRKCPANVPDRTINDIGFAELTVLRSAGTVVKEIMNGFNERI